VLSVIGSIFLWRYDRSMALLIAATVAYFVVISAGGESEARFRVPVIPQLAIAAALGVEAIRRVR
jgi:CHASE2 domain-containing sensor protein